MTRAAKKVPQPRSLQVRTSEARETGACCLPHADPVLVGSASMRFAA